MAGLARQSVVAIVIVVLLVTSVNVPVAAAADTPAETTYDIEIQPESNTVVGTITMESSRPTVFSFKHLTRLTGRGAQYELTIQSDASKLDGHRFRVPANDGQVQLRYRIELEPFERPNKQIILGLGESYGLFAGGSLFPFPEDDVRGDIQVTIDAPEHWRVFNTMYPLDRSWSATSFERLSRTGVVAGEVKYHDSTEFYSIPTHELYFNHSDPYNYMYSIEESYNLDPKANGRQHMKEIAFFTKEFADQLDTNPPKRIINMPIHAIYWRGWWQPEKGLRRGHTAHHAVHAYFPSNVSAKEFDEGFAMYYADQLAYEYKGERRFLGDRYLRLLILQNSVDHLHDGVTYPYIFSPNVVLYADEQIRKKSDGEHTFADVLTYINRNEDYRYKEFSDEELPRFTNEAIGIDISEEFEWALDNPERLPDRIYPMVREQYYDDFVALLDYQRREALAPDILYYAYLEMMTEVAKDDGPLRHNTERPVYPIDSYLSENDDMRRFVADLQAAKPVTEDEFISILNNYTDDNSNDFFTYYSEYARDPSLTDLNAYLDGEYSTLIRKQMYVERAVDHIETTAPENAKIQEKSRSAETLLNESKAAMNRHEIETSMKKVETALEHVRWARQHDQDSDEVPDLQEYSQGLDPTVKDTDEDGVPDGKSSTNITVDGYTGDWENFETKSAEGDGFVEQISVTKHDDSLYTLLRFREPYYEKPDLFLKIDARTPSQHDGSHLFQFSTELGPLPPGYTNNFAWENYTAVSPKTMEIRIPQSYLRFRNSPPEITLQAYQQGQGAARVREVAIYSDWPQPQQPEVTTSEGQKQDTTSEGQKQDTTSDGFGLLSILVALLLVLVLKTRRNRK